MAVITISRQFGAGGKTLAAKIAQALGYEIAHEQIVEKLAESAQLSADGIRDYEVENVDALQTVTSTPKNFIERIFDTKKYMDGKQYVDLLNRIIPLIAAKDNVLILGRGAQFILKDHPNTFHVLLIADYDDRVRFMQDAYQLSPAEAQKSVQKQGVRRRKLMKLFHSDDYDQPVHYDLVLNMSKMDMQLAVDMVCTLVQGQ